MAAVFVAAVGSKLLAWFEDPAELARRWTDWQFLLGGKTVVGGLLGDGIRRHPVQLYEMGFSWR